MKRMIALVLSLYICAGVLYGQNLNPYEQFGYTPKNQYVLTKTPQGITVTNSDKEVNVAKLVLGLKSRRMFFFDENDSLLNVITVPEDIFVRFISVDPLTGKYPELTPYQYASNRPIDGIDLDGLEHAAATMNGGFNQNARESVSNTSFPDPRSYLRQGFQEMKQRQGSIKPGREGLTFWQNVQLSISKLKLTSPAGGYAAQTLYSTVDDVYITYTNIKYGRGNAFDLTGEQTSYKQTIGAGLNTFSMAIGGVQAGGEKILFSSFAEETFASTITGSIEAVPNGSYYSVAYEMKLGRNSYPGKGYFTHFKEANTSLSNAMASDATFANSMSGVGNISPAFSNRDYFRSITG